jgi:cytochrome c-type biogenesis protein CcmF
MIPELGQVALILALAIALAQGTLGFAGAAKGRADWMALARPLTLIQCGLVLVALMALAASFVRNDFSVLYVASNSNSALPLPYRIAAVWGGHEGSLLLWVAMLVLWMQAVAAFSRTLPQVFVVRVLAVMSWVSAGFLLFMLLTSNPFERLLPPVRDGRDLNPLLQDPGMVFHPPLLYMGYVGFSVAFAFAIAALPRGRAGRGRGRSPRGSSSRSASRWAAPGPTTSWAGAAGGSGTRWKTPPSCPGWWAPR